MARRGLAIGAAGRGTLRLWVRLLNRNSRTLSLTEPGRVYFERCKSILEDLEDLEDLEATELETDIDPFMDQRARRRAEITRFAHPCQIRAADGQPPDRHLIAQVSGTRS